MITRDEARDVLLELSDDESMADETRHTLREIERGIGNGFKDDEINAFMNFAAAVTDAYNDMLLNGS